MRRLMLVGMCAVLATALFARGGWEDPPGGWLYVYEANEGEDAYQSGDWTVGCLDGDWQRSSNSDEWDGSAPGVSAPPPDGERPGGVMVHELAGEAEDGGDASVLSIENTGDPRDLGYGDPSNRKMFLIKDVTDQLTLEDGVTFCARLRLNPFPIDVVCAGCPDQGNGMELHDQNKGMLGFTERDVANINLVINDSQQLMILDNELNNDVVTPTCDPIDLDSATEWLTAWVAAQTDGGGTRVALFQR